LENRLIKHFDSVVVTKSSDTEIITSSGFVEMLKKASAETALRLRNACLKSCIPPVCDRRSQGLFHKTCGFSCIDENLFRDYGIPSKLS